MLPYADAHVFVVCADVLVLHEPIIAIHSNHRTLSIVRPNSAERSQAGIIQQVGIAHPVIHTYAQLVLFWSSQVQLESIGKCYHQTIITCSASESKIQL